MCVYVNVNSSISLEHLADKSHPPTCSSSSTCFLQCPGQPHDCVGNRDVCHSRYLRVITTIIIITEPEHVMRHTSIILVLCYVPTITIFTPGNLLSLWSQLTYSWCLFLWTHHRRWSGENLHLFLSLHFLLAFYNSPTQHIISMKTSHWTHRHCTITKKLVLVLVVSVICIESQR